MKTTTNALHGKCDSCGAALPVKAGKKSDCRMVVCKGCRRRWWYSCWLIKSTPTRQFHQIEFAEEPVGGFVEAAR